MSETQTTPFLNTLRWLGQYAGFPRARLPVQAERLILILTAAQAEEENESDRPSFLVQSSDSAVMSSQRHHAERRKRVHFKCDNSAKV